MNIMRIHRLAKAILVTLLIATTAISARAISTTLVIAEVYGGGGNSGSTYKNDFIVIFNLGNTGVDVNGWSVQYASGGGSTWQVTPLAVVSTIIPPGAYFLVQQAQGSGGTTDLPTPDATGTIAMGAGGGKVALVNNTTALSGTIPGGTGATIVDFVGFGSATTYEGAGATPAPSATVSAQRANGGCLDSDNNATDFATGAPNPRNSASPTQSCGVTQPPIISGVTPPSATINAGNSASFTVTLSQGDSPLTYYWYKQVGVVTNLIPSATAATLTLTNVLAADTADYFVVVSNASTMTATSSVVSLTVTDPAINYQPFSQVNLEGSVTAFTVYAAGTAPVTYQWYRGEPSPGANTLLNDGGRISGAQTRSLNITNTEASDADTYFVIVTSGNGSLTSDTATLGVATSGTLVTWDYNAIGMNVTNTEPSQGQATARTTTVGTTNSFQATPGSANDPINSVLGATNYYFGTATYPPQATANKTAGVQFNVSTLGFKNLTVTFDQRASGTGSKYTRLQFTTNGTDYIDYPVSTSFFGTTPGWEARSLSLVGFPGVANNPDFGIRVVSEFESTATLGAINNANYVGLAGTTGSYGTGGTLSYDLVKVNADPIGSGTPPTISTIANQSTPNITPIQVNFTVGDAQTAVGDLIVTATSYNETLVASGNITPGGAGASRNISITPSGVEGVCPILVSVTDADGDVTSTWFDLTLTPVNATPTITQIPSTNTLANTPISIPFVIGDDSPVGSLTLVSNSLNTTLIPLANIAITGSGANRTLVLTPVAANAGVAPISISVSDGVNTATTSFALTVRPTTNVVFNDYFDYADGTLTNVTGFFWSAHSEGLTGPISVASGRVTVDGSLSQDCNAPLIGAPYQTNTSAVLFSSFKVNCSVLPTASGAYFAHFKDNSTFGFYARVWATTNDAAPGKFRLSIGNSSNVSATSGQFPEDLDTGVDYLVVTRLVLSNGVSTIWINPTSESDTQVTDPTVITNSGGVYQYALRQSTGEGTLALDDLIVGTSFADVVPVLTVNQFDTDTVLTWANPLLPLQASSVVTGTYTNIPGATSPYTNALLESQKFFRLFKP